MLDLRAVCSQSSSQCEGEDALVGEATLIDTAAAQRLALCRARACEDRENGREERVDCSPSCA